MLVLQNVEVFVGLMMVPFFGVKAGLDKVKKN